MKKLADNIRSFLEIQAFGVCAFLGSWLGIPSSRIRIFFIYAACLSYVSPVIIYLSIAFVLNIRLYVRKRRNSGWDL